MKLTPEKIQQCAQWVRENGLQEFGGATVQQFCKANDIDKATYYRWLDNATFSTEIEKAKADFKGNLEKDLVVSLAKVAKGYKYTKRKTEYKNDHYNKPVVAKQTSEEVEVQPNVGAAIFLLTNINPERWKNKISNDVNANVKGEMQTETRYDFGELDKEDLFAIADKLQDAELRKIAESKENNKK